MVVKRRLLLAIASTMTLVMTAATPMMGATKEAQPGPLRQENLLRIKDMASNGITKSGAIAAVGWHEASRPGQLYVAFSTNGGRDYRRTNGKLRRYPIVGEPALGMSLAICANRVWVGTGYHQSSDKAGDSDVFLTSRSIGGGAAQALLTSTADDRRVRDVTVSCVGGDMVAIGWLQKSGSKSTAQLMLRSLEPLGTAPSFKKVYDLGAAEYKSGIAVASTSGSAAVAFVRNGDLKLKRFDIGGGSATATVGGHPLKTIAWNDVKYPAMAARGKRLVVAYTDAGKVRAKFSRDLGAKLSTAKTLVGTGGIKNPSKAYAVDVVADRIVVEAGTYSKASGKVTPQRLHSKDAGTSWVKQSFGHVGARYGTLIKKKTGAPLLLESWHNNAAKGSRDTLRARYELP
jgi:hypothetical protein